MVRPQRRHLVHGGLHGGRARRGRGPEEVGVAAGGGPREPDRGGPAAPSGRDDRLALRRDARPRDRRAARSPRPVAVRADHGRPALARLPAAGVGGRAADGGAAARPDARGPARPPATTGLGLPERAREAGGDPRAALCQGAGQEAEGDRRRSLHQHQQLPHQCHQHQHLRRAAAAATLHADALALVRDGRGRARRGQRGHAAREVRRAHAARAQGGLDQVAPPRARDALGRRGPLARVAALVDARRRAARGDGRLHDAAARPACSSRAGALRPARGAHRCVVARPSHRALVWEAHPPASAPLATLCFSLPSRRSHHH